MVYYFLFITLYILCLIWWIRGFVFLMSRTGYTCSIKKQLLTAFHLEMEFWIFANQIEETNQQTKFFMIGYNWVENSGFVFVKTCDEQVVGCVLFFSLLLDIEYTTVRKHGSTRRIRFKQEETSCFRSKFLG